MIEATNTALFESLRCIDRPSHPGKKFIKNLGYRVLPFVMLRVEDLTMAQKLILLFDISSTLVQGLRCAAMPYRVYKHGIYTNRGEIVAAPLPLAEQTIRDARKYFKSIGLYEISETGDEFGTKQIKINATKLGELMCLNISRKSYDLNDTEFHQEESAKNRLKIGKRTEDKDLAPPLEYGEPIYKIEKKDLRDKRKDQKILPEATPPESSRTVRTRQAKDSILTIAKNVQAASAAKKVVKEQKAPNHSMVLNEWCAAIREYRKDLAERASAGGKDVASRMLSVPWPNPTKQAAFIFIQNYKRAIFPEGITWASFIREVVANWDEYMIHHFQWLDKYKTGNVMVPDLQMFAKMMRSFIQAYSETEMDKVRRMAKHQAVDRRAVKLERQIEIAGRQNESRVRKLESDLRRAQDQLIRERRLAESQQRLMDELRRDRERLKNSGPIQFTGKVNVDEAAKAALEEMQDFPSWEEISHEKKKLDRSTRNRSSKAVS